MIKIATLNLCLGLKYKKDLVQNILSQDKIDILMLQETELESNFNCELLNIPGFKFEYEKNTVKGRVGTFIRDSIKYERCDTLEGVNTHLIIIDVLNGDKTRKRLINIYRSFNPNGETAKDLFIRQLTLIKNAYNNNKD